MADKDLTVEEILALCRQADGEGGGAVPAQEETPAEGAVAVPEPAAATPAIEGEGPVNAVCAIPH